MFFAQGYVEASLRLWQMEFTIFAAAGRLSEILGDDPNLRDKILEFDINQRRIGMIYGAENKLKAIEKSRCPCLTRGVYQRSEYLHQFPEVRRLPFGI